MANMSLGTDRVRNNEISHYKKVFDCILKSVAEYHELFFLIHVVLDLPFIDWQFRPWNINLQLLALQFPLFYLSLMTPPIYPQANQPTANRDADNVDYKCPDDLFCGHYYPPRATDLIESLDGSYYNSDWGFSIQSMLRRWGKASPKWSLCCSLLALPSQSG